MWVGSSDRGPSCSLLPPQLRDHWCRHAAQTFGCHPLDARSTGLHHQAVHFREREALQGSGQRSSCAWMGTPLDQVLLARAADLARVGEGPTFIAPPAPATTPGRSASGVSLVQGAHRVREVIYEQAVPPLDHVRVEADLHVRGWFPSGKGGGFGGA